MTFNAALFGLTSGGPSRIFLVNDIVKRLGGSGGHATPLSAYNEWSVLLGGAGGHASELEALTEVATLAGGLSPPRLFANGEGGAWYDTTDRTTVLQTIRTTTDIGQPVGTILDKARMSRGAERVVNGTFPAGIGSWTDYSTAPGSIAYDAANQRLQLTRVTGSNARAEQAVPITARRWYDVQVNRQGSAPVTCSAGTATGGTQYINDSTGVGENRYIFLASSAQAYLRFYTTGDGTSYIDNASVREFAGSHAHQVTATQRPMLQAGGFLSFDGVDDKLTAEFAGSLGSNCTVAYVTAAGVTILTGQTVGASYDLPAANWSQCVVIDRPLTTAEAAGLTKYLTRRAGL